MCPPLHSASLAQTATCLLIKWGFHFLKHINIPNQVFKSQPPILFQLPFPMGYHVQDKSIYRLYLTGHSEEKWLDLSRSIRVFCSQVQMNWLSMREGHMPLDVLISGCRVQKTNTQRLDSVKGFTTRGAGTQSFF